jgi:hypothetical protein
VKCYISSIVSYGAETWTLRKLDQKYMESFEMWCWRRMAKINWTNCVRNEEVLHRVKEDRNIWHTTKTRTANWIGHTLRRKCLLKYTVEGKIEGRIVLKVTWGRRRKKTLHDLKKTIGWSKSKEEALDRTVWRTRFGRGCGPVVRRTMVWTNEYLALNQYL